MSNMAVTAAGGGSEWIAMRSAELRIMNMFRDPEVLRSVVEAGRQEFARIVRTELRGLGLSMADIDRIFQVLRNRMMQAGSDASTS